MPACSLPMRVPSACAASSSSSEPVLCGQRAQGLGLARVAAVLHAADGLGAGRDALRHVIGVEPRLGQADDIGEDGRGARVGDRVGGRHERQRRHDRLVAGPQARDARHEVQCRRAVGDGDRMRRARVRLHRALELARSRALTEPTGPIRLGNRRDVLFAHADIGKRHPPAHCRRGRHQPRTFFSDTACPHRTLPPSGRIPTYFLLDTTRGGASPARLAVRITALHVRALLTDGSVALAAATRSRAAATAACPKLMPPSFGGSRSGTSTRRCAAARSAAVRSSRRRFWNTPPDSTTRSSPLRSAASAQAAAVATATPSWNRRATGGHLRTRRDVAGDRRDRRPRIDHAPAALVAERHVVCPAVSGIRGPSLKLNCSLTLVRHLRAQPAERGHGVEQAPHARGLRGHGGALADAGDGVPAAAVDDSCERLGQVRSLAARRCEPRAGHPPRLAHGTLPAGHAHRAQRGGALERHEVADEDLSTPDRAVGAVARAVVDRSDGRAFEAVLGEARGQMGVVVLDAREVRAVQLEGERRRGVVGVQVMRDQLGPQREQALEMADPLPVGEQGRVVLEIADVVADPGAAPAREAEGGLELACRMRAAVSSRRPAGRCSPARSRASASA